jgi:hypothetical protein
MGSGIQREDRKWLFAAIKDEKNNRHFWLFYEVYRKNYELAAGIAPFRREKTAYWVFFKALEWIAD